MYVFCAAVALLAHAATAACSSDLVANTYVAAVGPGAAVGEGVGAGIGAAVGSPGATVGEGVGGTVGARQSRTVPLQPEHVQHESNMSDVSTPVVSQQSSWLNEVAYRNMPDMVVTLDVSKLASDWSNEPAPPNMRDMEVTLDVLKLASDWSNELA